MLRSFGDWEDRHLLPGNVPKQDAISVVHIGDGPLGPTASVADAHLLFTADFKRSGSDLFLQGHDGKSAVVPGYFASEQRALLLSPEGAGLTREIVDALVGPKGAGQFAQVSTTPSSAEVVGRVAQVQGNAIIVRNGATVSLRTGDAVLKGDVLQTGSGALGVTFNDGSTLSLTANSRMVVNEFIYDPKGAQNSQLLDLIQGSLTFVSGEVAHTGNMKIGTPVATMGIRGTVGGVTTADDGAARFYVSQSSTGAVITDSNGRVIAQVVQDGPLIVVRPTGPLQVLAEEVQKSPVDLANELTALQHIVNVQEIGKQIVQQFLQPSQAPDQNKRNPDNLEPESTDRPHTQFQIDLQKAPSDNAGSGNQNDSPPIVVATVTATTTTTSNDTTQGFTVAVAKPSDQTPIVVTLPSNLAPINFGPTVATVKENQSLTFDVSGQNAISVFDGDTVLLTVTLTATHGTLSLSGDAGLSFSSGDGTADAAMTFSGTQAAINAALNGLIFKPDIGFSGSANVTVTTGDGASTVSETIAITVVDSRHDFLVSEYNNGEQEGNVAVGLDDGRFLAVWDSFDPGPGGVVARFFNADGTPAGSEFLVGGTYSADVVKLTNGDIVIVYVSGDAIAGRILSSTGSFIGSEFQINTNTAGLTSSSYGTPSIAAMDGNRFIVTWTSASDGSSTGIAVKIFDLSNGNVQPLTGELSLNSSISGGQTQAGAATLSDGNIVVTWSGGDSANIRAAIISPDGTALPDFLVPSNSSGSEADPVVAALSNGGFAIAWVAGAITNVRPTGIWVRTFDANGQSVPDFQVNTNDADVRSPAIVALPNGGYLVTWTFQGAADGDSSGGGIAGQWFDLHGQPYGDEFRVNTLTDGFQGNQDLAVLENGDVVVLWNSRGADFGDTTYGNSVGTILTPPFDTGHVPVIENANPDLTRASVSASSGEADGYSGAPVISPDGKLIAFHSNATNLTPTDGDFDLDVLAKNVSTGSVYRISSNQAGNHINNDVDQNTPWAISADNNLVLFTSDQDLSTSAPDWTDQSNVFIKNLATGAVTAVNLDSNGVQTALNAKYADMSSDGSVVVFTTSDFTFTPGDGHVIMKNLVTGELVEIDRSADGTLANRSANPETIGISGDGTLVMFASSATNLVPNSPNGSYDAVYVKNLETGAIILATAASDGTPADQSQYALTGSISANGRYVSFTSDATNLIADGVTGGHVYVKDLLTGTVVRADSSESSESGNAPAFDSRISGDGRYVAFRSQASNLVDGDTNGRDDVFVKDLVTGEIARVTPNSVDNADFLSMNDVGISDDGKYIVFSTWQSLLQDDTNHTRDVFYVGNPLVNAINRAPVITSNGGNDTADIAVSENTRTVTSVHATDADNDPVSYSIVSGADSPDAALFTIDATTGVLRFNMAPDYENPADTGHDNTYVIQVRASDGQADDVQSLAINVADDNLENGIYQVWSDANTTAPGTLRSAILYANAHAGTTITFAAGSSWNGAWLIPVSDLPTITGQNTVIDGTAGATQVLLQATGGSRIFTIGNGEGPLNVTVQDISVRYGNVYGGEGESGLGGAFYVSENVNLTIENSFLTDNQARGGAGGSGLGGAIYVGNNSSLDLVGRVELTSNMVIAGSGGSALGAAIYMAGSSGELKLAPDANTTIVIGDDITNATTENVDSQTLLIDGLGKVYFHAPNFYSGATEILSGTLQIGHQSSLYNSDIEIGSQGVLTGGGQTPDLATGTGDVIVRAGGTIAAGQSDLFSGAFTAVLRAGSLTMSAGSYLAADLNGTSPGVYTIPGSIIGYDQIQVHGSVSLDGATLLMSAIGGYRGFVGDRYEIVDNDGSDAVEGTFGGLQEGSVFTAGGLAYTITYVGGDGNDIVVTRVNTVPVSSDDGDTTYEDTAKTIALNNFGTYSDAENTPLAAVKIVSTPTNGALQYNDSNAWVLVSAGQEFSATDIAAGRLRFVPDSNENGSPYATLQFKVGDGTDFSAATYTFTIEVTPVNDAPIAVDDQRSNDEDGAMTFLYPAMLANDTDVDGDMLSLVSVSNAQHGEAFFSNLDGGQVYFDPDPNFSGQASFDYTISDGHGGSATATMTIDYRPYADAPLFITVPAAAGDENTAISLGGMTVSASDDSEVVVLKLSGFPTGATFSKGALALSGADAGMWIINDPSDIALLAVAPLTMTPPANFSGQISLHIDAAVTDSAVLSTGMATNTQDFTHNIAVTVAPVDDNASTVFGSNIQINTTLGQERQPHLASLAGGGFVAVWTDERYLDYDVKARIFDASGVPAGPDFQVNTTTLKLQWDPDVAALPGGGFIVVWKDESDPAQGELGTAIRVRIYDGQGAAASSTDSVVAIATASELGVPGITALPNGDVVISWQDAIGADAGPKAFLFGPSRDAVALNLIDSNYASSVAGLADGRIVSVSYGAGGTVVQFFDSDGMSVGSAVPVEGGSPGSKITALSTGGFVVSWTQGYSGNTGDIAGQVFDADGQLVGSAFQIHPSVAPYTRNSGADVSPLPNGGFVVAWDNTQGNGNYSHVHAQQFDALGNPVGDQIEVTFERSSSYEAGAFQHEASIATLANGRFVVAWSADHFFQDSAAWDGIFAQIFNPTSVDVSSSHYLSIAPTTQQVNENEGTLTFTVSRASIEKEETFYVSTTQDHGSLNKGDYTGVLNQALTFAAGELSRQVTVSISDDVAHETEETFGLIVQQSPNDPISTNLAVTTFTILDDDPAQTPGHFVLQPDSAGQDVWITSYYSYGDNYGVDGPDLRVGGWGDLYYSLLKFDLAGHDLPSHIESASLHLYNQIYGDYQPTGINVDKLLTAWTEDYGWHDYSLNYSNLESVVVPGSGWINIDVTAAVNDWLSNPSANYGLQLRPVSSNHNMDQFVSSDATGELAQYRPELVINWAPDENQDPDPNQGLVTAEELFQVDGKLGFLAKLSEAAYHLQPYEIVQDGINVTNPNADSLYNSLPDGLRLLSASDLPELAPISVDNLQFPTRGLLDGIYLNENAAALVARSSDSLFVSFRGTNDDANGPSSNIVGELAFALDIGLGGGTPDEDNWYNVNNHPYFSSIVGSPLNVVDTGMSGYFSLLQEFASAVADYIADPLNAISHVYVTGHSLGASMVQAFMVAHSGEAMFEGVTFGSPGFEDISNNFDDGRISNITIDRDPVPSATQVIRDIDHSYGGGGDYFNIVDFDNMSGGASLHDVSLYYEAAKFLQTNDFDAAIADLNANGKVDNINIIANIVGIPEDANHSDIWYVALASGDVSGTESNDLMRAGASGSVLTGEAGADTFIFRPNDGANTIADFSGHGGQGDKLELDSFIFGSFSDLDNTGGIQEIDLGGGDFNTLINLGYGDSILLQHVVAASVTADDFIFHPLLLPPLPDFQVS